MTGRVRIRRGGRIRRVNDDRGLECVTPRPQRKMVGTLSFPVRDKRPIHNNVGRIVEIIRRRQPALLLCAGWSVPTSEDLAPIRAATERVETVVVLEVGDPRTSFRVCGGENVCMCKQFFSDHTDINEQTLSELNGALAVRRLTFSHRQALLLVCGEISIIHGRPPGVGFRSVVPKDLRRQFRAPDITILNPTHTRMRRWEIAEWRKYLSGGGRTCVSVSNWDLSAGQRKPSPALHTVWHNAKRQKPANSFENEFLCYREWRPPK